jgi:hypothetical protein
MEKYPFRTWAGAVGLASLLLTACGADEVKCPTVGGTFEPLYIPRNSNCAPLTSTYRVPFDGGNNGVNMTYMNFANVEVVTEVVLKGCTVRMTQKVTDRDTKALQLTIDGEALNIKNQNRIEGMVELVQYDEVAGTVACSGQYDATFTKNVGTTGAAAAGP